MQSWPPVRKAASRCWGWGACFPTVSGGSRTLPEGTPASVHRAVEGEGWVRDARALSRPCPAPGPVQRERCRLGPSVQGQAMTSLPSPRALLERTATLLAGNPAAGSGSLFPQQCVCRRGRSNSYFCNGFERCYAPCPLKGEAAGKGSVGWGAGRGWSSS